MEDKDGDVQRKMQGMLIKPCLHCTLTLNKGSRMDHEQR